MVVKRTSNGIVVVTGSSGFIGAAAIKRLAASYTVVGFASASGGSVHLRRP